MAQGCLPPDVVAYVRYNYIIGAGRFCGGQWRWLWGGGDRDSKLNQCALTIANQKQRTAGNETA